MARTLEKVWFFLETLQEARAGPLGSLGPEDFVLATFLPLFILGIQEEDTHVLEVLGFFWFPNGFLNLLGQRRVDFAPGHFSGKKGGFLVLQ